jgi:hypothetical protein
LRGSYHVRKQSRAGRKSAAALLRAHPARRPSAAAAARVLGGPALQPLSAIVLEHDKTGDQPYAVGTLGGEMFDAFHKVRI